MAPNVEVEDVTSASRHTQQPMAPTTNGSTGSDTQSISNIAADDPAEPLAAVVAVENVTDQQHNNSISRPDDAAFAGDTIAVVAERTAQAPTSRGRGRGGLRGGRGKSRSSLSSTKARKRKRSDQNGEDDSDDVSSDEVCTPTAVTTKSGRSVQRPTAFVPPANASPDAGGLNGNARTDGGVVGSARVYKKKRVWRRNAENAVCKSCLRGTSPASNMIVFCDGCNTPYHRWCHHPPISQQVIDEPDKEWYCRGCARERVVPVPESELAHWIAAPGATSDERRQFFMSLTPGTMVTLLMRATNMQTTLPIFAPEWVDKARSRGIQSAINDVQSTSQQITVQPSASIASTTGPSPQQASTIYVQHDDDDDEDEGYGADEHPPHYVRPGKGLMSTLPPDKDDEKYLIDEDSSRGVFHHVYLVDESSASRGVSGTPS